MTEKQVRLMAEAFFGAEAGYDTPDSQLFALLVAVGAAYRNELLTRPTGGNPMSKKVATEAVVEGLAENLDMEP